MSYVLLLLLHEHKGLGSGVILQLLILRYEPYLPLKLPQLCQRSHENV